MQGRWAYVLKGAVPQTKRPKVSTQQEVWQAPASVPCVPPQKMEKAAPPNSHLPTQCWLQHRMPAGEPKDNPALSLPQGASGRDREINEQKKTHSYSLHF